jgi:hypothetical protein
MQKGVLCHSEQSEAEYPQGIIMKNPYEVTIKLKLAGNKVKFSLFAGEIVFLAKVIGILRFAQNDMSLFFVKN